MSSSVNLLYVSSSLSGNGFFSILGGTFNWASGMKGCICSSISYWLAFSPSVRGIKMLEFFSLDSKGIR